MQPAWLRHAERGGRRITRFYKWLCLSVGRRPARPILYGIALYFFLTSPEVRRASRAYLTRLGMSGPYWPRIYRHILTFSSVIVDRVFFLARGTEKFDLRLHGAEEFEELVRQGAGCLVVSAHFGNFDALRVIGIRDRNLPIKILMYLENARQLNAILDDLAPEFTESVIPLGRPTAMMEAHEWVEHGGIVGVLADRLIHGEKIARTNFLGDEADFPLGPWLLAQALDVGVILCIAIRRGGARYDIYFEPFGQAARAADETRVQAAERMAVRFAGRLEHYCRMAPYNWFNFYDFWATSRNGGKAARANHE